MKPSEIEVGKMYTDGKKVRHVLEVGLYAVAYQSPKNPYIRYVTSLERFARWAKEEVK